MMEEQHNQSNSGQFKDYEFVPAAIVYTDDPMCLGRIKVTAPGVTNANTTDMDLLPWVYPFTMSGNSSCSMMEEGSKVWLIRNKKRQDENWYIPMYENHSASQRFINENKDNKPEILSSRNNGVSCSSMTYDNKSGYNIKTGNSSINVGESNTANISSGGSTVNITDSIVTIGSEDNDGTQHAVLGDKLVEFLKGFINDVLMPCFDYINMDPYHPSVAQVFKTAAQQYIQALDDKSEGSEKGFLSSNVFINKNK